MTSREAVDCVKRLARGAKVGHAGTLDPLATGVLVVCVGAATRLIDYVQRPPKRYTGTFLLGRTSPTEDIEGEVTLLPDAVEPTRAEIDAALPEFVGRIQQRPPAFSALKVGGRRAYDLACRGQEVELAARPVEIHRLAVVDYHYPQLTLDIVCGSGTYIRSLGRDLAERLRSGAVMSALVRTAVGGFTLEEAIEPVRLTVENYAELLQPALRAVDWLPRVELTADEVAKIRNGVYVARSGLPAEAAEFAAIGADGRLVAILTPRSSGQLGAAINLAD